MKILLVLLVLIIIGGIGASWINGVISEYAALEDSHFN